MFRFSKDRAGRSMTVSTPWVAGAAFCFLALSVAAQADTYNFYFSKDKKKGAKNGAAEATTENGDATTESPDAPTPTDETTPNGAVASPMGVPPIVIHNHNTNTNNVPVTSTMPPPARPIGEPSGSVVAVPIHSLQETERSPFRFGLSFAVVSSDTDYSYSFAGKTYSNNYRETGGSLLAELGIDATRSFGLNVYSGFWDQPTGGDSFYSSSNSTSKLVLGAELQFLPFRAGARDGFDIFEMGFLFGGSNMMTDDHFASTHYGVRMNFNFGPAFGLTARTRISHGYYTIESGIIARL